MLKVLLFFYLLLNCCIGYSQPQQNRSSATITVADARLKALLNFYVPTGNVLSLNGGLDSVGALFYRIPDSTLWVRVGYNNVNSWKLVGGVGSSSFDSVFNGNRPITRDFTSLTGVNLGTTTTIGTLTQLLYPSQVPTATLTGGGTIELMAAGTQLPFTLSYTAGRQAATAALATIVVAGVTETFSQPAPSSSVSGTQAVLVSRNINTTFSNVVTTTDAKSTTATISYIFLPKRYYGFTATSSPVDATIQALTSEFVTTRTRAESPDVTPTGTQYFVIGFPQSLDAGNISHIWVGGLDQTGTFTRSVRSFTNASGYTQSYIFYTSINPTNGTVKFEIK